jgi:hypothetical protein
MRDHAEPQRYYDWMLWKNRELDREILLDKDKDLLLELQNSVIVEKYPELGKLIEEILIAEKLTT